MLVTASPSLAGILAITSDDQRIGISLRASESVSVSDLLRHSRGFRDALALGLITVTLDATDSSDFVSQVELTAAIAAAGAAATETERGEVELATQAEAHAGTATVGTDGPLSIRPAHLLVKREGVSPDTALVSVSEGDAPDPRGDNALDIQSARNDASQVASGYRSTAVGNNNTANGIRSSAIGHGNMALGLNSTAVGHSNYASQYNTQATAVGYSNTASNDFASAFGNNNTAAGYMSSAIGFTNTTSNLGDSAVGFFNTASGGGSAFGNGNTASVSASSAFGYANTAGNVEASAFGRGNTASGQASTAVGFFNTASGTSSSAIGNGNAASSIGALAFGLVNTASNYYSSAFGYVNTASGIRSSAFGTGNMASNDYASAHGRGNLASANSSSAFGHNNTASASYASAFGYGSTASASRATALGHNAVARVITTTVINGPIIARKDNGEGTTSALKFQVFNGVEVTLMTEEINFKGAAPFDSEIAIPSGCHFWINEIDVLATSVTGAGAQPFVRAGIGGTAGTPAKYILAVQTTDLTASYKRQRYTALLADDGESSATTISAGFTVAATTTTFLGRFVFKGILVEDE